MQSIQRLRFRLALSADDYMAYYRGAARQVVTQAETGQRVRFPASALRPYVTHSGVQGRFEIHFDQDHRMLSLIRLGD